MRPKFLPRGCVTTEEPPIEPAEFDEYDQAVVDYVARNVIITAGIFIVGVVLILSWVSARVG